MRIQYVDNNVNLKRLYFIKSPNVIYNRQSGINYDTKGIVGFSERGYKYVKDLEISKEIKDIFHFIPFIMNLLTKVDAFVFFREISNTNRDNIAKDYISFAKILWLDTETGDECCRTVYGNSKDFQKEATEDMMRYLLDKDFAELRIM